MSFLFLVKEKIVNVIKSNLLGCNVCYQRYDQGGDTDATTDFTQYV